MYTSCSSDMQRTRSCVATYNEHHLPETPPPGISTALKGGGGTQWPMNSLGFSVLSNLFGDWCHAGWCSAPLVSMFPTIPRSAGAALPPECP